MKEKISSCLNKSKASTEKAINRFAECVVRKRKLFLILFSVLFVLGLVGFFFVKTNYDSTAYLPDDSEIKKGLSIMYDEFGENGNASLMLEKPINGKNETITYAEAINYKNTLLSIDGVSGVLWIDDLFSGLTSYLGNEYENVQYAEGILILLNSFENMEIESLIESESDLGIDFGSLDSNEIVDFLLGDNIILKEFKIKSSIEDEIDTGNYALNFDTFKSIVKSVIKNLTENDSLNSLTELDAKGIFDAVNGFKSSLTMFYSSDSDGIRYPLYQITFSGSDYSQSTMDAIKEIRNKFGELSIKVHMSGNAATTYNSIDCVEKQTLYALIAVGGVVLLILFLFSTSFWEPVLYLLAIAIAVVINMGSNIIMGSVSYLTSGIAGILQLALSMDYSIFLLTRFKQEKAKTPDVEQAMINAVKASFSPISASSMTTIASFVALMFMSYTIGLDMGIVFAKGVILSLLSVFMLLPGLAVYTNKLIEKSEHKCLKLTLKKFSSGLIKGRFVIPIVAVCLIAAGIVGQNYLTFGYGDTATFGSEGSLIYEDKQKIESVFGSQNQLAILLKKEKGEKTITSDDGVNTTVEEAITKELAKKTYVLTAQSKSLITASGMADILPQSFLKQFDNNGEYTRLVTYIDLPEEGAKTEKAMDEIRSVMNDYQVEEGEYFLLGGSSSAIEIKQIVNVDYNIITWISIGLVALILFITFKNAILPVLLVFIIQGSIWISTSISALTGDSIVFLGYLIVSAVMLGATIDYGILLTSNYLESRKKYEKFDAIKDAIAKSSRAILTSSVILCCAGILISLTSSMPAIKVFGDLIGRMAACSFVLVMGALPCVLVLFDKVIYKSMLYKSERKVIDTQNQTVTVTDADNRENNDLNIQGEAASALCDDNEDGKSDAEDR